MKALTAKDAEKKYTSIKVKTYEDFLEKKKWYNLWVDILKWQDEKKRETKKWAKENLGVTVDEVIIED